MNNQFDDNDYWKGLILYGLYFVKKENFATKKVLLRLGLFNKLISTGMLYFSLNLRDLLNLTTCAHNGSLLGKIITTAPRSHYKFWGDFKINAFYPDRVNKF